MVSTQAPTGEGHALLFPGQGAQKVGMLEPYKSAPGVKAMFKKASKIFGTDLLELVEKGPAEKLNDTRYSQVCVFLTSMAAVKKLEKDDPDAVARCNVTAGFSLGEYSALTFAGVMELETALTLLKLRGEAMGAACDLAPSGMMTVIGLEDEALAEVMPDDVTIANQMFPKGRVLSGSKDGIAKVEAAVKALNVAGVKTIVQPVGGRRRFFFGGVSRDFERMFLGARDAKHSSDEPSAPRRRPLERALRATRCPRRAAARGDDGRRQQVETRRRRRRRPRARRVGVEGRRRLLLRSRGVGAPLVVGGRHLCGRRRGRRRQLVAAGATGGADSSSLDLERRFRFEWGARRDASGSQVSGAFHSPYMASAADKLETALASATFGAPNRVCYSNVDGRPHAADAESIKCKMKEQLMAGVLWEDTMNHMKGDGVVRYFEPAPGRQLSSMLRRIDGAEYAKMKNV